MGLVQKGHSRTWLDDRGWFLITVEFQPSGWSKGTYLNVGATWLWHPKDFLSFDYGDYRRPFEGVQDGDWDATARSFADTAASWVGELRSQLPTPCAAAERLREHIPNSGWPLFDAAIASGLCGDAGTAAALRDRLLEQDDDRDWAREMRERAARLLSDLDRGRLAGTVAKEIAASRTWLRLPELPVDRIRALLQAA